MTAKTYITNMPDFITFMFFIELNLSCFFVNRDHVLPLLIKSPYKTKILDSWEPKGGIPLPLIPYKEVSSLFAFVFYGVNLLLFNGQLSIMT